MIIIVNCRIYSHMRSYDLETAARAGVRSNPAVAVRLCSAEICSNRWKLSRLLVPLS